eukprot:TRINITY_DN3606_c0_g1_i1.p2 TRINITY_DN3606_c0_g1~~TRINITY_DN3606_c0_g1_i1.p2  ORF type:complete len:126 (-),score=1.10 TRINITY_DN3606_c0_g1_i1:141-518(-)
MSDTRHQARSPSVVEAESTLQGTLCSFNPSHLPHHTQLQQSEVGLHQQLYGTPTQGIPTPPVRRANRQHRVHRSRQLLQCTLPPQKWEEVLDHKIKHTSHITAHVRMKYFGEVVTTRTHLDLCAR